VSKEILIHVADGERRVAILVGGKLDDYYIELDRYQSMLGKFIKAKLSLFCRRLMAHLSISARRKMAFSI